MRTWMKNGIRFTVLATTLAAMSAGVAYSQGSMDGSTLLTGQPGEQQEMGSTGLADPVADGFAAGERPAGRGRVAGLAAVAIAAAGSIMLIRRLRRRGSSDGDEV
jgi:hypothetical protein